MTDHVVDELAGRRLGGPPTPEVAAEPDTRLVHGLAVVSDEPIVSPLRDRSGNPVMWKQVRTLRLADDSVMYGCGHCEYVSANIRSIRPHLHCHVKRRPAGPRQAGRTAMTQADDDLTLNELLAKAAKADRLAADVAKWKSRAQKAERTLKALRKALGVA